MVVCRQIRELSDVPILILTAREDSYDEVSGLEQGADDFVNKPVQPRVLLARLRALLRRTQPRRRPTPANWPSARCASSAPTAPCSGATNSAC
jgi:two-component system OmpR family response regulator